MKLFKGGLLKRGKLSMNKFSIQELRDEIVGFRKIMGDKTLAPEKRVDMFRALTTLYLNVDVDDSEFETVAAQYISTSNEYVKRMCLMGLVSYL
jgi:hypothetical protein